MRLVLLLGQRPFGLPMAPLLGLTAALGGLAPADAQGPAWAERSGTYLYAGPKGADEHIERTIERATAELGFVKQRIARSRLESANHAYDQFQVFFNGGEVVLRIGTADLELALGRGQRVRSPEGREVHALARIRGNTLVLQLKTGKGRRINRFRWLSDTIVQLSVRIESRHLPEPVTYGLRYERAP